MNPINLSTSKRLILLIGIVLIVIVLLLLMMAVVTNKPNNTNTATKSTTHPFPSVSQGGSFPNGSRYQSSTYSIAYPQDSQNTSNVFAGGSMFITQPPNYPGEPVLDVEAYDSAQNLAQKESLYLATGATRSTITVNNMTLPELRNTYDMRTINSKPIHTPTQLRLAYLVKPHAMYVFRMYYSSSTTIPADETLFSQFIQSFSLK